MLKAHTGILQQASTLAVVAGRAGGNHICPGVPTTQVARDDVVNCQFGCMSATILAGIMITAEDFPPGQFQVQAGTVNHSTEQNDRGTGIGTTGSVNEPAAVCHHVRPPRENQTDSPLEGTNMDGLKIGI